MCGHKAGSSCYHDDHHTDAGGGGWGQALTLSSQTLEEACGLCVCKICTTPPQEICGLIPRKFVEHPEIPVKRISMFRLKCKNINSI